MKVLECGPKRPSEQSTERSGRETESESVSAKGVGGVLQSYYYTGVHEAPSFAAATATKQRPPPTEFFVDPDTLVPYVNAVIQLLNDLRHSLPLGTLLHHLQPMVTHSLRRIADLLEAFYRCLVAFFLHFYYVSLATRQTMRSTITARPHLLFKVAIKFYCQTSID